MTAALQAHRVETTLTQDGTLTLDHLPFQAGESVEIIILPHSTLPQSQDRYPLRGTSYAYEGPMESAIADEDWDALR